MIVNSSTLATLQAEWEGVVQMRERMRKRAVSTFTSDVNRSPGSGDILYNLPLVLAFDVLKQALLQAKEEGLFAETRQQLADLMESAKTALPWNDSQCLREGVNCRNEIAQNGKLYGDVQCLHYIADVEAQLLAWGIITPAQSCLPDFACLSLHKEPKQSIQAAQKT